MSKDPGLCASAILSDDVYIVKDAKVDPRTLSNPLVAGLMGLQFYAAAPLKSKEGYNLGTFCIIDKEPRSLSVEHTMLLRQLARMVINQLELRLQSRMLSKEFEAKSNN
ncbi:MAG: GAF domain-containing protein [Bacteroidota bacterium]